MTDFTYVSDTLDESTELKVDQIMFGDGYSQRIPTGINNGLRKWQIQFNDRSQVDVNAMDAFWRDKAGATSFTWQPQGFASEVHVVCKTWSRPIQNRFIDGTFVYTISATFEEVPL